MKKTEKPPVARRKFLQVAGVSLLSTPLWLPGCSNPKNTGPEIAKTDAPGLQSSKIPPKAKPNSAPSSKVATPSCHETEDNIEGPYYREGAPFRENLLDAGMEGTRIIVTGYVFGLDCETPLSNTLLDIWQANDKGQYDNDGSMKNIRSDQYLLRGKVTTDENGFYRFTTIIPGRYLNGSQYRPAHIHVKTQQKNYQDLTTQLYFPKDPFNDVDPFIKKPLLMKVTDAPNGEKEARFDFILPPV